METPIYHQLAAVESSHWWFQGRRRIVATMLRDYLADHRASGVPGLRVLDVGSGMGEMVDMLRAFGRVTAMDSSEHAIEYLRQRHPTGVSARRGLVPDDLAEDEEFDLVTAFDVVEHIDDDVAALRGFRRVLAPGGRLVLTVPAFPVLWSHHDVYAGHVRRYRRHHLRDLLRQAGGFQADRIAYFNSLLFLPAFAARTAGRLRRRVVPREAERVDPHLALPAPRTNRLLYGVFASEARMLPHVDPPFGVSLIALCRAS
ncbi:class I SAM-dependent methyltransferase [Actinomadura violacea]|uniref:Class I SAM-dependent methyltransferase n=1 Tax=Actinomadura violacea TaxID=2819934 RepID=A0ABS3S167_9ACTN|nr:class I SAM-dependent methyltransferase [Actinomadura violacea]MBO2462651.1 class I SAM-dependent methyltransferase [Actinomadura violacea]